MTAAVNPEQASKLTKCAVLIFQALPQIRRDSKLVLMANERSDKPRFDLKESAMMGVSNLACVVEHGSILREEATYDAIQSFGVAITAAIESEGVPENEGADQYVTLTKASAEKLFSTGIRTIKKRIKDGLLRGRELDNNRLIQIHEQDIPQIEQE